VVDVQPVAYGNKGSGWQGTDTSRDRAERADSTGISRLRVRQAAERVSEAGGNGLTVTEFEAITGLGHGPASSALTHAHRGGHIARLAEKRGRCKVYVSPDWVGERETERVMSRGYKHPRQYTEDELREAAQQAGFHGIQATFAAGIAARVNGELD
jgi:hypothetical protein